MRLNFNYLGYLLFFCTVTTQAQIFTKTGVLKMQLKNSGVVMSNNEVKGYYLFYTQDKRSANLNNYQLTVLDENMREINSVTITRPTTYNLIEGAFNGTAFCFLFYDVKSKSTELLGYDRTLKQTGSTLKKLTNKFMLASYQSIAIGAAQTQDYIVPIENKGFLYYSLKEGKKQHYEIEHLNNNMERVWRDFAAETAKIETAYEAFQHKKYIGSIIVKKATNTAKNLEYDLMVQNLQDGSRLFRIPMITDQYTISVTNVSYDSTKENFIVFGEYFGKNDQELKDIGLGFITLIFDIKGQLIYQKTNSWATEISQAAPFTDKGKFEGLNANVLFHQTIRTADGQIFLIGEQYKKAVSGTGVALNILGGIAAAATGYYRTVSNIQLNIYNMVIFQFNPDYSLNRVHLFEKTKNVVMLPTGYGTISPRLLSYYAKSIGGFDFTFAQLSSDKSSFLANYINFDRNSESKSKNVLGSIVYTPEKIFVVDKMELPRRSADFYVTKAKNGYVAITEYFRKEKKIESRLEKINY